MIVFGNRVIPDVISSGEVEVNAGGEIFNPM